MKRLGLIGFGYWGPNYLRIGKELFDLCKITVVCDQRLEVLASLNQRHPDIKCTTVESGCLEEDIDAVIIATNPASHYRLAKFFLEAGKDVLVEKPFVLSVDEARRLLKYASVRGAKLMVAHTYLFNPAIHRLKAIIGSGQIGQVRYCKFIRAALGPIRKDVNVVWDLMIHDFAILDYLFHLRTYKQVTANGMCFFNNNLEDVVDASFVLNDQIFVSLLASWIDTSVKTRKIQVIGTRGAVTFDDVDPVNKLKVFFSEAMDHNHSNLGYGEFITKFANTGDILIPKVPNAEPLKEQLKEFLYCSETREDPISGAKLGVKTVELSERINLELTKGK